MFRVAICDDNDAFREYEKRLIYRCLNSNNKKGVCDTFGSGEEILALGDGINKYDMIILDCKMDNIDGVKTAEQIRKQNDKVKILFSTDYYEFSQSACNFEPIGYLIKNSSDFESILCRKLMLVYMKASERKKYITDFVNGTHKVNVKDVIYINSYDHYLYFYLRPERGSNQLREYKKRGKLDNIANALDDSFVRVNVSYLVNMNYIESIAHGSVNIKCGEFKAKITIKRGGVELVEEKFNKYIGAIEW